MAHIQDQLTQRIKTLEKELEAALEQKERAFQFRWAKGKVKFEEAVLAEHRKLKSSLARYVLDSTFLTIFTAPVIYIGIVPFILVDLFLILYQTICFPVWHSKGQACGLFHLRSRPAQVPEPGGAYQLHLLLVRQRSVRLCPRNFGSNRTALVPDQARTPAPGVAFPLRAFHRLWQCRPIPRANRNRPQ